MNTLAERLALAMKGPPEVKAIELARACGVKQPSVSGWLSGKSKKMEGANLLAAAEFLKINYWWLANGTGPMRPSQSQAPVTSAAQPEVRAPWPFDSLSEEEAVKLPRAERAKLDGAIALALAQLKLKMAVAPAAVAPAKVVRALVAAEDGAAANDPDYVALPLKRVKIRAGVAGFSLDQTGNGTAGAVYVPRAWLAKRGINPEVAFASHVGGMSMWPRVQEGDVVVVNPGDTERRNGIVYAFNHDGEFVLKRLKKQLNRWYLTSDNPDKTQFPPVHADEGTFMIGRAVLLQAEEI